MQKKPSDKSLPSLYLEITKPRILLMVLVTTALGYYLANPETIDWMRLAWTLLGSAFAAAGAGALNSCIERGPDAKMDRTKFRPLPQQKLSPQNAMLFGVATSLIGVFLLQIFVNLLASFLCLLTVFLYIMVYTPLKQRTWLNTFVGAVPGALPILIGWTAATNGFHLYAWLLFLVLFAWQHPHFYAIAWMYKDDYRKGGFQMLPVIDETGRRTFFHVIFYAVFMLVVSVLPSFLGLTGVIYLVGASLLGLFVLIASVRFVQKHTIQEARFLLRSTLLYFPLLFAFAILDSIL